MSALRSVSTMRRSTSHRAPHISAAMAAGVVVGNSLGICGATAGNARELAVEFFDDRHSSLLSPSRLFDEFWDCDRWWGFHRMLRPAFKRFSKTAAANNEVSRINVEQLLRRNGTVRMQLPEDCSFKVGDAKFLCVPAGAVVGIYCKNKKYDATDVETVVSSDGGAEGGSLISGTLPKGVAVAIKWVKDDADGAKTLYAYFDRSNQLVSRSAEKYSRSSAGNLKSALEPEKETESPKEAESVDETDE